MMTTRSKLATIVAVSIASTCLTAQPANAGGIVQDVLNGVQNIVNQATNAANNARNTAQEAVNQATVAKNKATEMVDNMHDGLQNITDDLRERIQDAVEELKQAIEHELEGAAEFTNGPNSCSPTCEEFREKLINLLTDLETITNGILSSSDLPGALDLQKERDFVQVLPGKVLFPLYRVLNELPLFDQGLLDDMSELAANLDLVKDFIVDATTFAMELDQCVLLAENEETVSKVITVAKNVNKVGKVAKITGSMLNSVGQSKISVEGGIWGWAGVTYTGNLLGKVGTMVESLGNHLTPIADKLQAKLRYCVLKTNQEDILATIDSNQALNDQKVDMIMAAIKAIPAGNGADLDRDGDIDLADFSKFQNAFVVGPG